MPYSQELNCTYRKLNTFERVNQANDNPCNGCNVCGKKFSLHDKAYNHVSINNTLYLDYVCETCVKKEKAVEKL